jgi:ATP-dependent HslUV protease subunit HslV
MAGDGQVSLGDTIVKMAARKVRRLGKDRSVIGGFAGSAGDSFALFEKFEQMLEKHSNNLTRAAVELAKEWRMDRALRRLEALLLVADAQKTLLISGAGDVVEPDEGVMAIGSGGNYALSAAKALLENTDLPAIQIAEKSMKIAAGVCVYTNDQLIIEKIPEK